jgi:hypothetical protein
VQEGKRETLKDLAEKDAEEIAEHGGKKPPCQDVSEPE